MGITRACILQENLSKNQLAMLYMENVRRFFCLWEYISGEGMQDDAREYLEEHGEDELPFEIAL